MSLSVISRVSFDDLLLLNCGMANLNFFPLICVVLALNRLLVPSPDLISSCKPVALLKPLKIPLSFIGQWLLAFRSSSPDFFACAEAQAKG